jgi:glycerophosphoryl diester phosphodiesterase
LTADGKVVVFHDDTVDRLMQGSGRVDGFRLAALEALPFKAGTDHVPTLEALLATVGGRAPLVVEMKSSFKGDRSLEAAAAPLLLAYGGPLVVMSFDPDSMAAMKRLAPTLPRGVVADRYTDLSEWGFLSAGRRFALRHLLSVPAVGAAFVAYDLNGLPSLAPSLLRAIGMPLITWTVRSPADRDKARRVADQITFEGFDPDA